MFDALETSYLSAALPTSEKMALGIDWLQVGITDEELDSSRSSFNFAYSYAPVSQLSLGANLKYFTWSIALDGRIKGGSDGLGHGRWSPVPTSSPLEVGNAHTKFHRFWIWGRIKVRHLDTTRFRCQ